MKSISGSSIKNQLKAGNGVKKTGVTREPNRQTKLRTALTCPSKDQQRSKGSYERKRSQSDGYCYLEGLPEKPCQSLGRTGGKDEGSPGTAEAGSKHPGLLERR